MMEIFQALLARRVVEAHGKKWVTLYYIGKASDDGKRDLYIAIPFDAPTLPAPCSVIAVDQPKTDEKAEKTTGETSDSSDRKEHHGQDR